jgi:type IV pilus assembly protein PilA
MGLALPHHLADAWGVKRLTTPAARAEAEAGFTLMELLVVLVIIGVLLAIAVPSYIGLTSKSERAVAQANVREAVPAVEAFYSDNSSYVGLENAASAATPGLAHYDPATSVRVRVSTSPAPTQSGYCIYSTSGGSTYFKDGPNGSITKDPGPVLDDCNTST